MIKRGIAAIFKALILVFPSAYRQAEKPEPLALDNVIELSKKGDILSQADFKNYESVETGNGLYILAYDINEIFFVDQRARRRWKPIYIHLAKNSSGPYIDLRTEDVAAFLNWEDTEPLTLIIKKVKISKERKRAALRKVRLFCWFRVGKKKPSDELAVNKKALAKEKNLVN